MSRLILLALVAAAVLAVIALIVGVFSSGKAEAAHGGAVAPNGVQKVAYGVLIALMFGVASGALGDG